MGVIGGALHQSSYAISFASDQQGVTLDSKKSCVTSYN